MSSACCSKPVTSGRINLLAYSALPNALQHHRWERSARWNSCGGRARAGEAERMVCRCHDPQAGTLIRSLQLGGWSRGGRRSAAYIFFAAVPPVGRRPSSAASLHLPRSRGIRRGQRSSALTSSLATSSFLAGG